MPRSLIHPRPFVLLRSAPASLMLERDEWAMTDKEIRQVISDRDSAGFALVLTRTWLYRRSASDACAGSTAAEVRSAAQAPRS